MNEKRFRVRFEQEDGRGEIVNEKGVELTAREVVDLLNEQQATINRMKHSLNTIYKSFEKKFGYDMRNAIWLIDEISYEEWEDKLHIAETDAMNHKESSMYWKNKCDEQQATIRRLQDLCGQSDSENAKLRIENKKLKAKLKEKEEDERLYANEILELRETNKEHIKFKSLGGNY